MAEDMKDHGSEKKYGQFHRRVFEANAVNFAVWATIAILIGGIVEIVPMFTPAAPRAVSPASFRNPRLLSSITGLLRFYVAVPTVG